ncbi:PD40 domain-containing protein [Chloroflexota bacterium]|nr:PD40 domain-containing protein [Chloroflexota bacterium]
MIPKRTIQFILIFTLLMLAGCGPVAYSPEDYPQINRAAIVPVDIEKRSPATDSTPPILHSTDYAAPIPVPGGVNTSGGEDSPFILPDGETLYLFFTPDVRIPAEQQFLDGVTGIYVAHKQGETWGEAERVWLEPPDILSLDGAPTVDGDTLWFATIREGIGSLQIFTAHWVDGRWQEWQPVSSRLRDEIMIGELEIYGDTIYFHSDRPGGKGGLDIWMTTRDGDTWTDPINIEVVNTEGNEGWPDISPDGSELWFTRTYNGSPAIFRCLRQGEGWGEPELILSQFAGESSVDSQGNLYFTHHYFENGQMIEADIYVARHK